MEGTRVQLAAPEAVELPGLTFTVIHRCVWKGRRKCVASLGVLHSVHLRFSYCGTRDCMPSYHFPHKFTGRGGSDSACFLFSQIMLFLNDFFRFASLSSSFASFKSRVDGSGLLTGRSCSEAGHLTVCAFQIGRWARFTLFQILHSHHLPLSSSNSVRR